MEELILDLLASSERHSGFLVTHGGGTAQGKLSTQVLLGTLSVVGTRAMQVYTSAQFARARVSPCVLTFAAPESPLCHALPEASRKIPFISRKQDVFALARRYYQITSVRLLPTIS